MKARSNVNNTWNGFRVWRVSSGQEKVRCEEPLAGDNSGLSIIHDTPMNILYRIRPTYPPPKELPAPCSLYSIRHALFCILAYSGNVNQSHYSPVVANVA